MESTLLESKQRKASPNGAEEQLDVKELLNVLSLVKNGKQCNLHYNGKSLSINTKKGGRIKVTADLKGYKS